MLPYELYDLKTELRLQKAGAKETEGRAPARCVTWIADMAVEPFMSPS